MARSPGDELIYGQSAVQIGSLIKMAIENNKNVIRQYVSAWSRGEVAALTAFWSPDLIHHTRNGSYNFQETEKIVARFLALFPEMRFQIEDLIAEGDRVVTRMTWRAPHKGDFMSPPVTSEAFTCTVIGIARLSDGK